MNCHPLKMLFSSHLTLILKLIHVSIIFIKKTLDIHNYHAILTDNVVYHPQIFILTEDTNNLHTHMLVFISTVMVSTAVIRLTKSLLC